MVFKPNHRYAIFDDTMIQDIVRFTNKREAKIKVIHRGGRGKHFIKLWKDVTVQELMKFIGLSILMGNVYLPSLKH